MTGVNRTELDVPSNPAALLRDDGFFWARHGEGIVAWGEAERIDVGMGPDRIRDISARLGAAFARLDADPAAVPLAYGSFTFDPDVAGSWVVIPRHVLRFGSGGASLTSIGPGEGPQRDPAPALTDDGVRYGGSSLPDHLWLERVAAATAAIEDGEIAKVVLARDVKIWSKATFDQRALVERLQRRFPECYTFACRGLLGASPELLVSRSGEQVRSLTLAGSARRGEGRDDDALGRELLSSPKERSEHGYAVRSVTDVLETYCKDVRSDEAELLRLENVQHIATRIEARVDPSVSALDLAGYLHPSAAVCGTPREQALARIRSTEGMARGRYAGPVGWVDARGDGEWAIALRCAEVDGARGRLFAGAGIVAGSEPEAELEETRLKLRAMMSVLGE